ncbi:hypothetical protein CDL15_Pgr003989 [Punica granatum]|uniref:Beta-galactosidase n=1 Tax=Punica granatum TaxID=22663 RepID=A0A218WPB8_PUNGR|nr:hypothetical protein CDL15_Pgr003989 [Punica granatum]
MARLMVRLLALSLLVSLFIVSTSALDVSYDSRGLKINGKRKIIMSGSIHYPRSTPEMWPDLIKKAKEGGLNAIETYVFWNAHEPLRRQYDFSGRNDLVRFIKTIQENDLYAILRIGPYVCAEWNYGGFPVWLHNLPGIQLRTNNTVFMNEMKHFTTMIVEMMRREKLYASQGGPIILAQIENEYGNIMGSYGSNGKSYVDWCAKLAQSFNIEVPWIMCQQGDAPQPMINTCNGWYCDQFNPNNKNSPKIWTENWTGWFKDWGMQDPHRTAEDVAFAVARFFQYGGSLQNYYMYHGGTNFGRTSGGPYITTSYDYDAPLDEYGNKNQPKWGHLKKLHEVIMSMETILTNGVKREVDYGNMMSATIYMHQGKQACFLGNANWNTDFTVNLMGTNYTVPAWSVTILPDCYTEVYNTAKINTQISIMEKLPNEADDEKEPYELKWQWRPEHPEHLKHGTVKGSVMSANKLLDQKVVTNDTSDYLWHMTSIDVTKSDPLWCKKVTLQVKTKGHVLHAFVNGKHVGSQYGLYNKLEFTMDKDIKLKLGTNTISLLSATVGLANYGARFDEVDVGIHGPVKLIGNKGSKDEVVKDLSGNKWTYKIGLEGIEGKGLQNGDSRHNSGWQYYNLPSNRLFIWYKAMFKAPLGTDPVVVDLNGLGKGIAWVNGHNIGRYWPAYAADQDGCSITCDYRGTYGPNKCLTNCGNPSQRWYHIPRSYLRDDNNLLVLFEEFGGSPLNVKFQTVTPVTICGNTYEGNTLDLSCQGGSLISEIRFLSFGNPKGSCGAYEKGTCEAYNAASVIKKACLGKQSCSIEVSENVLGPTGCHMTEKNMLAIEAICH